MPTDPRFANSLLDSFHFFPFFHQVPLRLNLPLAHPLPALLHMPVVQRVPGLLRNRLRQRPQQQRNQPVAQAAHTPVPALHVQLQRHSQPVAQQAPMPVALAVLLLTASWHMWPPFDAISSEEEEEKERMEDEMEEGGTWRKNMDGI